MMYKIYWIGISASGEGKLEMRKRETMKEANNRTNECKERVPAEEGVHRRKQSEPKREKTTERATATEIERQRENHRKRERERR